METRSVTSGDRSRVFFWVLQKAEYDLGIKPGEEDMGPRIDRVLRGAIGGRLEPRYYAALWILRTAVGTA
jgi:hypothetical protein